MDCVLRGQQGSIGQTYKNDVVIFQSLYKNKLWTLLKFPYIFKNQTKTTVG